MIARDPEERIRERFARLVTANAATALAGSASRDPARAAGDLLGELAERSRGLGTAVERCLGPAGAPTPAEAFEADFRSGIETALSIAPQLASADLSADDPETWLALLAWLAGRGCGGGPEVRDRGRRIRRRLHAWKLDELMTRAFVRSGRDELAARRASETVLAIHELPMWRPGGIADPAAVLESWLADAGLRRSLHLHRGRAASDFSAEGYSDLVTWTTWVAATRLAEYPQAFEPSSGPMLAWVMDLGGGLRPHGARRSSADRLGGESIG